MRLVAYAMPLVLAGLYGCHWTGHTVDEQPTIESSPSNASEIRTANPVTASQLLRGFYPVEQSAWRWTESTFAVALGVPPGARQRGANLVFEFAVPDAVVGKLKQVTVRARAGGVELTPPETCRAAGQFRMVRELPAAALRDAFAGVEFQVDPFLTKGEIDQRELGVIAVRFALEPR